MQVKLTSINLVMFLRSGSYYQFGQRPSVATEHNVPEGSFTEPIASFLERHAHTVRIDRPKFLRSPGLGLQRAVRMNLAASLLEFGI